MILLISRQQKAPAVANFVAILQKRFIKTIFFLRIEKSLGEVTSKFPFEDNCVETCKEITIFFASTLFALDLIKGARKRYTHQKQAGVVLRMRI